MTIGTNIKRLRQNKEITQECLSEALGISSQAVSKWENDSALPDILMLPRLADYFGITIDELMGYKLNALTYREQFVRFLVGNGIIQVGEFERRHGRKASYYLDTEKLVTNAQLAKIGEYFADRIQEQGLEFDVIMGMAYHGIAFSAATACALFQKYGVTAGYCHERKVRDSRGRMICGHELQGGERIVLVDDLLPTGMGICKRIQCLRQEYDVKVEAVIVIADLTDEETRKQGQGARMLELIYGTNVYSIINEHDILKELRR